MDEAATLFEQGITLLREKRDPDEARRLLLQGLRLDPNNDMAWVWLSRAVKDPVKRRECLKRALVVNPENPHAQKLLQALEQKANTAAPVVTETPAPAPEPAPVEADPDPTPWLDDSAVGEGGGSVWIDSPEALAYLDSPESFDAEAEPAPAPQAAQPARVDFAPDEDADDSLDDFDDVGQVTFVEPKAQPSNSKVRKLDHERRISRHLKLAQDYLNEDDPEGAITEWVRVLELEVDHEVALREGIRHLSRLGYIDDARELVWRALESGTTHPSVYLTAIDIARHQNDHVEADDLRERFCYLAEVDDAMIVKTAERFLDEGQSARAKKILEQVLEDRPKSQTVMNALGDLHERMDNHIEAMRYYDRAARIGAGTKAGREADKRLLNFAPVITDRERGSSLQAWREVLGIGLFFLLLAWQDAGLNLLALGLNRWLGLLLSVVGGYLLVTATSSPQQPIARLLGGVVPDSSDRNTDADKGIIEEETELPIIPPTMRFLMGIIGAALLLVALALVFGTAISLLLNPVVPPDIPTLEEMLS
jgi:tetratricopeptide (TPR) repeat protein